jgi:hypothetical protein
MDDAPGRSYSNSSESRGVSWWTVFRDFCGISLLEAVGHCRCREETSTVCISSFRIPLELGTTTEIHRPNPPLSSLQPFASHSSFSLSAPRTNSSKITDPKTNTGPELNATIRDWPHHPRFMHFHSRWKNLVNSVIIGSAGFGFGFGAW